MWLLDKLLGKPLATREEGEHMCPLTGIPMLGLDALALLGRNGAAKVAIQ